MQRITLIKNNIPGETPKEKYEKLLKMKDILILIAFPRRGTYEEQYGIQDIADLIILNFTIDDLEEKHDLDQGKLF